MTVSSETFKALGDPTRLALFALLLDRPRHVGELVERLAAPQPRVSRHLRVLKDAGLVEDHRRGRRVEYRVAAADPSVVRLITLWAEAVGGRPAGPPPAGTPAPKNPPAAPRATGEERDADEDDAPESYEVRTSGEPFDSYLL